MSAKISVNSCKHSVSSAVGTLSFLDEPTKQLQAYALDQIYDVVDLYWPEIAEYLTEIEKLYEDETFSHRELAGIIASKIYYHLEEYSEALKYALGAGTYFNISEKSQFTNTILGKCIDEYIERRNELYEFQCKSEDNAKLNEEEGTSMCIDSPPQIDKRLENIVERMLWICIKEGDEKQALGVAFDAKRIDFVENVISNSKKPLNLIQYCLKNTQQLMPSKRFSNDVMNVIVKLLGSIPSEDFNNEYSLLCTCLYHQGNANGVASILHKLLYKSEIGTLLAYQVAFDLVDLENQSFLNELLEDPLLQKPKKINKSGQGENENVDTGNDILNEENNNNNNVDTIQQNNSNKRELNNNETTNTSTLNIKASPPIDEKLRLLRRVLSGKASIDLNLQFLHRNNHSDLILLNDIKNSIDQRVAITHNALVIAHGLMQAGTSCDIFLRNNLEWLSKALNWAKFTATASLGVIHKGQTKDSRQVLSTYLPGAGGVSAGSYSEGGALYALGLIHANHMSKKVKEYLLQQLRNATNDETLQHGACLGLGLLCLGTNDDELYEILKGVLFMDSAVVGEAAAYAIGLVMLASASRKALSELLAYAHDTQHEKIIRACSVAMSMVMYRREEEADALIDQLLTDKDALVRYGAMYTIGMAYCGTSKNTALRQLLHVSVSDVSDDVRRAAVIAVGFVLCNAPKQVPKILNLLAKSYNAHVRYAAALTVGISCAGTAFSDAINLLMPMTSDTTDFVRQGAFIGLGLVLQQVTECMNDKVKQVREMFIKVIGDKHDDIMARFGAILATGLLDAGGRNTTATFFSKTGNLRREAAVGFCLFSQFWYWYPLTHCISLAFQPNAFIGVNKNLKIPVDFVLKCTAPAELFAYPPPTPKEKKAKKKEAVTAILSTVAKRQAMKANQKVVKSEGVLSNNTARKLAEEDDADAKIAEKVNDLVETSSVVSDGKSLRGAEVSSVAATIGDLSSSAASHAGSIAGSTVDGDFANINNNNNNINNINTQSQLTDSSLNNNHKGTQKTDEASSSKSESEINEFNMNSEDALKTTEKNSYDLRNPFRVLSQQERYIEFYPHGRYVPLSNHRKSGYILLRDTRLMEKEVILETENHVPVKVVQEREPPEPFEWSG